VAESGRWRQSKNPDADTDNQEAYSRPAEMIADVGVSQ
jgi:hypothetical protein